MVALVIRTFVVQPFFIPSGSMEPTLKVGDRVLVNKLSYDFHSVHRGDIVVFKQARRRHQRPGINDLIKRVIGLPGETISARTDGQVLHQRPAADGALAAQGGQRSPGPARRRAGRSRRATTS